MANNYLGQGEDIRSKLVTTAQATTSITAVTLTQLQFPNLPAGTYAVDINLIYRVSAAGNPSFGVTGGTLSSLSLARKRHTTTTALITGTLVTAYGVSALSATTTANIDLEATLKGRLTTSAAGTFAVQFASPIATTTLTVQPGSYCVLYPQ